MRTNFSSDGELIILSSKCYISVICMPKNRMLPKKRMTIREIRQRIAKNKYKSGNPVVNAKIAGAKYYQATQMELSRLMNARKKSSQGRTNVTSLDIYKHAIANTDIVYGRKVQLRKMNGKRFPRIKVN